MILNYKIDLLIFLLSSDWFRPAWHSLGLGMPAEEREILQATCSSLAREVLQNVESYWDADFSEGRVQGTQQKFVDVVSRVLSSEGDKFAVFRLLDRNVDNTPSEVDLSLVSSILQLALAEDGNSEIRASMPRSLYEAVSSEDLLNQVGTYLEDQYSEHSSSWDAYLVSMTPEQPECLLDYAIGRASDVGFETKTWARLRTRLSLEEYESAVAWINKWSIFLTNKVAIEH